MRDRDSGQCYTHPHLPASDCCEAVSEQTKREFHRYESWSNLPHKCIAGSRVKTGLLAAVLGRNEAKAINTEESKITTWERAASSFVISATLSPQPACSAVM